MKSHLNCVLLVAALTLATGGLSVRPGKAGGLAIDRDGNSLNPVKVVVRFLVHVLDEMGTPHP